jgi:hypothetical protein
LIGCDDGGCLNRVMKIHCDAKTCPCGAACANRPFHLLDPPPVEAFLTSNNRGHGVRAVRPIRRGSFVVEYAGEVIDAPEMRRRMEAQRRLGQHHFYIMELGPGLFIDALRRGNHARLLNSSCEPNCETQKWCVLFGGRCSTVLCVSLVVCSEPLLCPPCLASPNSHDSLNPPPPKKTKRKGTTPRRARCAWASLPRATSTRARS